MIGRLRALRTPVLVLVTLSVTLAAVLGLRAAVDPQALSAGARAAAAQPGSVVLGLTGFAAAFVLRAVAWRRLLPELGLGQALAAIHLSVGGNHVLPFRLGEPLRVVSVVRRTGVDVGDATASTIALRAADMVALVGLGLLAAPALVVARLGTAGLLVFGVLLVVAAVAWSRLARRRSSGRRPTGADGGALALTTLAWVAEAVLVHQVLAWFGVSLSPAEALVVLATAVGSQLVAVTPGGLGTYEAAATAALVAVGVAPTEALAAALLLHALKTAYSLLVGLVGLFLPRPALWGRLRVPTRPAGPHGDDPTRRAHAGRDRPAGQTAPVVLFLPAHDEGPRVADVVRRAPVRVDGHPVEVVVIDDGSRDDTAARARAAGARLVSHDRNRGLGAAVRTGLADAVANGAAAVAFCDADGEYDPAELALLVRPILAGTADYVVGSRFAGDIQHMRPHRRMGNQVLTRWLAWTVRHPVSDGQSGYRALSAAAAAAADLPHDYNYAQVLTIDLVTRGFRYAEVPITYRFRQSGRSFVHLPTYLRAVLPVVWRQLNPPARRALTQSGR